MHVDRNIQAQSEMHSAGGRRSPQGPLDGKLYVSL